MFDGTQGTNANRGRIYVNASEVANTVDASMHAALGSQSTIIEVSGQSQPYDGLIDEVRIWNIARTEAQVAADYQKELSGSETGLIAYWKFNEGTGTNVNDETSSGLDLTLVNTPVWSTDVPFPGSSNGIVAFEI